MADGRRSSWRSGWFSKGKTISTGQGSESRNETPQHGSGSSASHIGVSATRETQVPSSHTTSRETQVPSAHTTSSETHVSNSQHRVTQNDLDTVGNCDHHSPASVRTQTANNSRVSESVGGPGVVDPRIHITVSGNEMIPIGKVSRGYLRCFETKWFPEGHDWASLSSSAIQFYFEEFKKSYRWDESIDSVVFKIFKAKASKRYSDVLSSMRSGKMKRKVRDEVWNQWKLQWTTEKFKKKSQINSKNHKTEHIPGGGVSTHSCGSRSMKEHKEVLTREQGEEPGPYKLFVRTHSTKNEEGKLVPVCEKAKEYAAMIEEKLEAATRDQIDEEDALEGETLGTADIDEAKIYFEAVNGMSAKQRVYGVGSCAGDYFGDSVKSTGTSMCPNITDGSGYEKMKTEIEQNMLKVMDERLREERDKIRREERDLVRQEERESIRQELMMTETQAMIQEQLRGILGSGWTGQQTRVEDASAGDVNGNAQRDGGGSS